MHRDTSQGRLVHMQTQAIQHEMIPLHNAGAHKLWFRPQAENVYPEASIESRLAPIADLRIRVQ
jgi:hypothetical protein